MPVVFCEITDENGFSSIPCCVSLSHMVLEVKIQDFAQNFEIDS